MKWIFWIASTGFENMFFCMFVCFPLGLWMHNSSYWPLVYLWGSYTYTGVLGVSAVASDTSSTAGGASDSTSEERGCFAGALSSAVNVHVWILLLKFCMCNIAVGFSRCLLPFDSWEYLLSICCCKKELPQGIKSSLNVSKANLLIHISLSLLFISHNYVQYIF